LVISPDHSAKNGLDDSHHVGAVHHLLDGAPVDRAARLIDLDDPGKVPGVLMCGDSQKKGRIQAAVA